MKKLFKWLIAFLVLFGGIIGVVFYLTSDLVLIGNQFVSYVKENNYDAAYELCSEDFKSSVNRIRFEQLLTDPVFKDFRDSQWSSRSIDLNSGKLRGVVSSLDGNSKSINLDFINSGNGWKIQYLEFGVPGISSERVEILMPTEEESVRMVDKALAAFANSVKDKDMSYFYSYVSNLLQKQISKDQLNQSFESFFKISNFKDLIYKSTPVFTQKPSIDSNGLYLIKGYYPLGSSKLQFELQYIKEGMSWKIATISLNFN